MGKEIEGGGQGKMIEMIYNIFFIFGTLQKPRNHPQIESTSV